MLNILMTEWKVIMLKSFLNFTVDCFDEIFVNNYSGIRSGTPYAGIESKTLSKLLRDGYRMPKPEKCTEDM